MITLPQRDSGLGKDGWWAGAATRNLRLRIASAAVLAPIVLVAAYLGGWFFLVLCTLGAGGILWEWTRLIADGADPRILAPGAAALLAALACAGFDEGGAAAAMIGLGAILAGITGCTGLRPGKSVPARSMWAAGGVLYAGVAFLGPALLRRDPDLGLSAFLFLAATVWMTDICAYAVGRAVGGPLLWPRISPNKTWAGAIGGLAGGLPAAP